MKRRLRLSIKRLESRALLIWFALACALWTFLALADEIGEGETGTIDRQLIAMLRTTGNATNPIGPTWFKEVMRDVTALGGFTFLTLITVVFVLGLLFHKKWREGVILTVTALGAQISVQILKLIYDRPRPEVGIAYTHGYGSSFPSGHTTESTAIFLALATVIATFETRHDTKILAYAVAFFVISGVGFSRVYLGMHWPSDVFGGWILGTSWALGSWIALRRLAARK